LTAPELPMCRGMSVASVSLVDHGMIPAASHSRSISGERTRPVASPLLSEEALIPSGGRPAPDLFY
jgi:hypothetical protein